MVTGARRVVFAHDVSPDSALPSMDIARIADGTAPLAAGSTSIIKGSSHGH
jgi:hypothetical protein